MTLKPEDLPVHQHHTLREIGGVMDVERTSDNVYLSLLTLSREAFPHHMRPHTAGLSVILHTAGSSMTQHTADLSVILHTAGSSMTQHTADLSVTQYIADPSGYSRQQARQWHSRQQVCHGTVGNRLARATAGRGRSSWVCRLRKHFCL